jgi:hypothetical protein
MLFLNQNFLNVFIARKETFIHLNVKKINNILLKTIINYAKALKLKKTEKILGAFIFVYVSYDYDNNVQGHKKNEGKKIMLETSQERVKLLKAGISTKKIEQLYLESNCFKIIDIPVLVNVVKIIPETKVEQMLCEVSAADVHA